MTQILPHLVSQARPVSELKGDLVGFLKEGAAEVAWAALREPREDVAKMLKIDGAASVLGNLHALQTALDSKRSDPAKYQAWMGLISTVAGEVVANVQERCAHHSEEWSAEGALPTGCEWRGVLGKGVEQGGQILANLTVVAQAMVDDVFERVSTKPWRTKLTSEIQRAMIRTLARPPTRRADIYDRFVRLWLEREITKVAGQRGAAAPEKLRLEVSGVYTITDDLPTLALLYVFPSSV